MKVIQIIPSFALAGAETMCENLIYALRAEGAEVIAISLYDYHSPITERLEAAGVDIRYLDKKKGFDLSIIKKLREIFKEEKPDVVHSHLYAIKYTIFAARRAKIKKRVHTVHTIAQKECGKWSRKLNKIFYKYMKITPVALSEIVQESMVDEYKLPKEKIPVILNGIDLSKCQPKTDYTIKAKIRILHIGRFSKVKNHKGLIEAFHLFHQEYPHSILQLIGEGELREDVERQVNQLGLSDSVEFLGLQENVHTYLHEADIFTLPSNYEGIPMTLIEAMGTGLPIVATNVGGIPDMIINGENGVLTGLEIESIKEGLTFFVDDLNKREVFGGNAKLSAERFSVQIMAKKYIEVYTDKYMEG